MSIFKETFPQFIQQQIKIRERIMGIGMGDFIINGNEESRGRMGSIPMYDSGFKDKFNGNYGTFEIDTGAFHTYTTQKSCTIRMSSGVNLSKYQTILEGGRYEKEKDLVHEGLAQRYILEGGSPIGVKNRAGDLIQAQPKGFPGTYNKGKARTLGFAYGDPLSRGDANGDGFGIVPMPGITGCNVRTKSAYGSLREASVSFVCYNQRQLEILELLYMRPGYTILLEWGWTPYVSNKGKITNDFPYISTFFDSNATHEEVDKKVFKNRISSGGNYDAIMGICKNFEYKLRSDGGYDCTTELIARGEVLEGLKFKRETVENLKGKPVCKTSIEFILEKMVNYGDYNDEANDNIWQGGIWESISASGFGKWAGLNSYEAMFDIANSDLQSDSGMKFEEGKTLYPWVLPKDSTLMKEDGSTEKMENSGNEFNGTFVKWEFLAACINNRIIPSAQKQSIDDKDKGIKLPLFEISCHETLNKYVGGERVKGLQYAKVDTPLAKIMPKIGNATIDYLSIDMSADPSVCLLPHQIVNIGESEFNTGKIFKEIAKGALWCVGKSDLIGPTGDWWDYDVPAGDEERMIGAIYLNAEHMLNICKEMAYDGQGKHNPDFSVIGFLERIWGDVNTATGGTHDFKIHVDHEKNNQIRIIDMIFDQNNLEIDLDKIVKINIQSPESIVREVAYNTSIPSALSTTIAVAAQAPSTVDDLESVTWAALNKNIYNRFTSNANEAPKKPTELEQAKWRDAMNKDLEIIKKNCGVHPEEKSGGYMDGNLPDWRTDMLQGEGHEVNEDGGAVDSELINEKIGMMKSAQSAMERVYLKYGQTIEEKGIYYGMVKPTPTKPRSAIIPLKFNCKMDGIGGIVIGNVFKLPKDRLPRGYDADDVSFIVMGEEQNMEGNDWTTTINGHLILLGDTETGQYEEGNWDSNQYDESKGENYMKGSDIDPEQSIIDPDMNSVGEGDTVYLKINESYTNFRSTPGVNNEVDLTDNFNDNNIGMFDKGKGGLMLGEVVGTRLESRSEDGGFLRNLRKNNMKTINFLGGNVVDKQYESGEVAENYEKDGTIETAQEKLDREANQKLLDKQDGEMEYVKDKNAIVYKTSTKKYYAKIDWNDYGKLDEAGKSECIVKNPILGGTIGENCVFWKPMDPDTVGNMASLWFEIELTQDALDHFNLGWVMNKDGTRQKDGETVTKWRIDKNGADDASSAFKTTDIPGTVGSFGWDTWYSSIKEDGRVGRDIDWMGYGGWFDTRTFLYGGRVEKKRKGTITGWMRIDTVQASADFSTDPVFEAPGKAIGMDNPSFN